MKGYRKLVVEGKTFHYRIGKSFVEIRRNNGTRLCTPSYANLSGLGWNAIEKGVHKKWFAITPLMVRTYLEKQFLESLSNIG